MSTPPNSIGHQRTEDENLSRFPSQFTLADRKNLAELSFIVLELLQKGSDRKSIDTVRDIGRIADMIQRQVSILNTERAEASRGDQK